MVDLPLPCITQTIYEENTSFSVLKSVSKDSISHYDHNGKLEKIARSDFEQIWTGICLLMEKGKNSHEPGIEQRRIANRVTTILALSVFILLILWMIQRFYTAEFIDNAIFLSYSIIYTVLKIAGLVGAAALLWFEIDEFNPALQTFCSGGKKINCSSVLNSKYATFLDGNLSLGLVGFSYFFGSLGYLPIAGISYSSLALLGYLSFLTVPVILISLYYQAFVIKQWCKLCVIVQAVLVVEVLSTFIGRFYVNPISIASILLLILSLLVPILAWKLIKPLLQKNKEVNIYKRGLQKIKRNPDVLQGLLSKSRKINTPADGLGILLSNSSAKYNIIKVCKPYCGPCAKAHPILEELVEAGKINLQILFTTRVEDKRQSKPVKHFLAINEKGNKEQTQQALDQWYNTDKKEYDNFAARYPMNGELLKQDKKIAAMRSWCDAENITHTPTLFINGHELPKEYSVADLKEVLI